MINLAAIVPHTPLLVPSIGGDKFERLQTTILALQAISQSPEFATLDTLVIFSKHGATQEKAFSVNLSDEYQVDLSAFGDLSHSERYRPDYQTIDTLQRELRRLNQPITLDSETKLDHSCAVPLLTLGVNPSRVRLILLSPCELPLNNHFAFGQALRDIFLASDKKIGLIASGDLSHALSTESPAGFALAGPVFDAAIQKAVKSGQLANLQKYDEASLAAAEQCLMRPLLLLAGVLNEQPYTLNYFSYDSPFGVGYLTAELNLN